MAGESAAPDSEDTAPITMPSGNQATLIDVIHDVPGPAGITWRYRFVMPKLAELVPVTTGPATEELTPEDIAELDRLGAPPEEGDWPDIDAEALAEAELVSPEDLDLPNFTAEDFAADAEAEEAYDQALAVPPDPDLLLLDPVHKDIAWLCDHWIIDRLKDADPLPAQVIISVADRPTPFGEFDIDTVQLFEAFSIAPDRSGCVWEPW